MILAILKKLTHFVKVKIKVGEVTLVMVKAFQLQIMVYLENDRNSVVLDRES